KQSAALQWMACVPVQPAWLLAFQAPSPGRLQTRAVLPVHSDGVSCKGGSVSPRSCCLLAGALLGCKCKRSRRSNCARRGEAVGQTQSIVEEETEGDYCTVAWDDTEEWARLGPDANRRFRDAFLAVVSYVLPVVGPAIGFWQWKNILSVTHAILGDERQLLELMQVTLTPATNGIVAWRGCARGVNKDRYVSHGKKALMMPLIFSFSPRQTDR
ncbi:unnamed protein product, partial [Effrenium voratum]